MRNRWLPRVGSSSLIVLTDAAQSIALDGSAYIQILHEAGHLDATSVICCVDLGKVPDGLDAAERERYLREHGETSVRSNPP